MVTPLVVIQKKGYAALEGRERQAALKHRTQSKMHK